MKYKIRFKCLKNSDHQFSRISRINIALAYFKSHHNRFIYTFTPTLLKVHLCFIYAAIFIQMLSIAMPQRVQVLSYFLLYAPLVVSPNLKLCTLFRNIIRICLTQDWNNKLCKMSPCFVFFTDTSCTMRFKYMPSTQQLPNVQTNPHIYKKGLYIRIFKGKSG